MKKLSRTETLKYISSKMNLSSWKYSNDVVGNINFRYFSLRPKVFILSELLCVDHKKAEYGSLDCSKMATSTFPEFYHYYINKAWLYLLPLKLQEIECRNDAVWLLKYWHKNYMHFSLFCDSHFGNKALL